MKVIYTFPFFSTVCWGVSIVGGKILTNGGLLPVEIVFLRFALAGAIFLPVIFIEAKDGDNFFPRHEFWFPIVGLAITGVAVNNVIFYYGLNRTSASVASLLVSFTPLTTLFFATLILNEKFTKRKLFSVMLGVIGVAIIVGFSSGGKLYGNLFIILAISIWGSSFSFSKLASNKGMSSIAITGWSQILGTIILAPFIANEKSMYKYGHLDNNLILWFIYMGIVSSVIAYVMYYHAIAILGTGKVAPTTNLIPLSGVIAAWIILGDPLRYSMIIGAILILIAVLIVQLEKFDK